MRVMMSSTVIRPLLTVFIIVGIFFSCSADEDRRKTVEREYGEPDEIIESEFGGMKSQIYVYAHADINRAYEFRKSTDACGGSGKWYVYRMYYANYLGYELYRPPEITHTPITQAPVGQKIIITATITDDSQVVEANMFYRVGGQEDFFEVQMIVTEGVYRADIPAVAVIDSGLEYYIEARDEGHSTFMPDIDETYLVTVGAGVQKPVYGLTEQTPTYTPPPLTSDADAYDTGGPLSP
jgi:hypothetical protein